MRCPVIDMVKTGENIRQIMDKRQSRVREVQAFPGLSTPSGHLSLAKANEPACHRPPLWSQCAFGCCRG